MDGAGARETPHAAMAGESSGNEVTAPYEIADDELQAAEVELQQRKLEGIKLNAMRAAADAERQSAIEQAMRKKAEQQQREHEERVRRVNEEQFDAFCVDCQDNRSTHCVVTFGIFICARCVEIHEQHFSPFQSMCKALFEDAWDNFQINCV